MSTFFGLEISRSSLFINQKAMTVTGHNIANANTAGYTRQSLVLSSLVPTSSSILTQSGEGRVGGGVQIQQLRQIRDSFLDIQFRRENRSLEEWAAKADVLRTVEDIFNEPSETGINSSLIDFFNGIQELGKAPESIEIRTLLRQSAIKLTETFHHHRAQLSQLQQQQDVALDIAVQEINGLAMNIRELNLQIFSFEQGGQSANDLRDQRNLMLDRLSGLIQIDYYENDSGRFRIDVNGFPMVEHGETNLMETIRSTPNPIDTDELYTLRWKDTQEAVRVEGGQLKGLLDMRDGSTPDRAGIPYFIQQLDNLAKSIAHEFNEIHRQGYTIPYGDPEQLQTGVNFFSSRDGLALSAKNISVDAQILKSVNNIAASTVAIVEGSDVRGNNLNILRMAAIRNEKNIVLDLGGGEVVDIGNFEDYSKKLIAGLAVESSHSVRMTDSQGVLTFSIDHRRQSVSGVSVDEEMTDLIRYQHAYSASARMVTAIDQMLETLIQRTGVVGR